MKKNLLGSGIFLIAAQSWAGTSQIDLDELQGALDSVLSFFTSGVMKSIFAIALAGMLVALGLNRENPELKKRFLFWAIAIGGLLGLSSIMDVFFTGGALL